MGNGTQGNYEKNGCGKQASDLHSNNLAQRIIYQFLLDNSLEDHLTSIRTFYKEQADFMITSMKQFFPVQVKWIVPKGGMFIWATLPEEINATTLLEKAIEQNVLFVPGQNFYVGGLQGSNSLRINFSHSSKAEILKGIKIMGALIRDLL